MPHVLSIATLYPNAEMPRFGTFVARQMEALAAQEDWDVTVINPIGVPPIVVGRYVALSEAAISRTEGGVDVHRPRFTLLPAVGGPINPPVIAYSVMKLARRLHAAEPFDLVDAQFFYPDGPAAARIADALGLPLSIKARGADISYWGSKGYALQKMRWAARRATGLLAVSDALKQDMVKLGLPEDKITVHYTGLDRDLFRPLDRKDCRRQLAHDFGIQLENDEKLVVSVGALIPRKGQSLLIDAITGLPDTHLALVGTGADRSKLEDLASDRGVRQRVHFLGSLDHGSLPVVLSAADVMALNSASEGLANAWVEALACGTPLVITDVGGARELVQTDSAGRLLPFVASGNAGEFTNAISEVFAAQYSQEDVAANAARFSWEANAAALAEYYQRLIAN